MKKAKEKLWFKAKCYGWGWYPCSWEGWLVLLVWAFLFVSVVSTIDHEWLKNLIFIILSFSVLIYLCYKKGEKPRWRWGK